MHDPVVPRPFFFFLLFSPSSLTQAFLRRSPPFLGERVFLGTLFLGVKRETKREHSFVFGGFSFKKT